MCLMALGWAGWKLVASPQSLHGQQTVTPSTGPTAGQSGEQLAPASTPVIKAETRLVLVDTIVTDKHGAYVRDLTAKNFKVWEDDKEQTIKSFSYEADPASPTNGQKHYMVLFFDTSTMEPGEQAQARQAAARFIDSNAGPNHYMAVINYGGAVHVSQNFTTDAARLKQVVSGVKIANTNPNAGAPVEVASIDGMAALYSVEGDYGARTLLLSLRSVAKNLSTVPGRKSLVLLTGGFPWSSEAQSELTAVIAACNKANVAVYPVDVRGLFSPVSAAPPPTGAELHEPSIVHPAGLLEAGIDFLAIRRQSDSTPHLVYVQHSGGGGGGGHGGGGGSTGGHSGGTTGGTGGNVGRGGNVPPPNINPMNRPRSIVPTFPPSATTNQQILYELAQGTGGFVIVNTNDLQGGMEKVSKEQTEYYSLGYTPEASAEGTCHVLKVKVDRSNTIVRSRSGYCNTKPQDLLAGKPASKALEDRATGSQAGNITASMLVPYFFTSPNTARVDLAIEMPPDAIKFEKDKGKQHATVNILGIAYKQDGNVAARFSDSVDLTMENKDEMKAFLKRPFPVHYQFEVAAGQYNLKVVFSQGGESFGKLEVPLAIESFDGKKFTLSALALSRETHKYGEGDTTLDSELLQDRKPLVTQGIEVVPAGSNQFKKSEPAAIYVEAYAPLLTGPHPPKIGLEIKIIDRKTGEKKIDAGVTDTSGSIKAGNPVVPLGLALPIDKLPPGSYRVELIAIDSAGNNTKPRSADFDLVQ
jgi:VWFA-related protein